jgi:S1-C subfamily serine protease
MALSRQNSKHPRTQWAMGLGIFLLGLMVAIAIGRRQNQNPLGSPSPPPQQLAPLQPDGDRLPNPPVSSPQDNAAPEVPFDQTNFIVRAVRRVEASVVRIEPQRLYSQEDLQPLTPSEPIPYPPYSQGAGTGFVIDDQGHVLTNAHVIDNAEQVRVVLQNGRSLRGTVLGQDSITDVAVVKLDDVSLVPVPIGDSDALKPGEWAIAIGNPLGLDSTVTMGIISATGRSSREIGVPERRVGFIQTDAAINPGNSGGPLLNASGAAIGMNTAILDGAQGLGFAIPIKTALRVGQQIIANGVAQHSYLGVRLRTLDAELQAQLAQQENPPQISVSQGVLIVDVVANSPAETAGLQLGDVILAIDERSVIDFERVQRIVEDTAIGDPLQLKIARGDERLTLEVRPGPLPINSP